MSSTSTSGTESSHTQHNHRSPFFCSKTFLAFLIFMAATIGLFFSSFGDPPRYPPSPEQKHHPVSESYNPRWLIVSRQCRVAVTIIPKVMCTSIRSVINNIECRDPTTRCAESRINIKIKGLKPHLKDFTRVVLFRDPIERALSTYRNSDINPFIHVNGCHTWRNCTFEYWVRQLSKYRNATRHPSENEHFIPQTVIAQRDRMHYDYQLRMSNRDHVSFFFWRLLGSEPVLINNSSNSVNSLDEEKVDVKKNRVAEKFEQDISVDALLRLMVIYEKDFQLWESLLQHSPRASGEYTMYDYFTENLQKSLQPEFEHLKYRNVTTRVVFIC